MGVVSLLSDFTYEGAKAIMGPYLAYLGASALVVGFISGLSESLGYILRLISGYLSDRLKNYWTMTFGGYTLNLLSIPLMGLAPSWYWVSLLVVLERLGKGLRTPSRDALLSNATVLVGHGKGFGLHEFMDQLGAILGPFAVGLLLYMGLSYRSAFLFLLLPALFALISLYVAKKVYERESPSKAEKKEVKGGLPKDLYLYTLASSLIALSFLPFPLIGFHLVQSEKLEGWSVALIFALAMLLDAISALLFGLLFDKVGFYSLAIGLGFGLLAPVFLFMEGYSFLLALVLWGISLGVQESIMRSAVAKLSPSELRGTAYGVFHLFFGLGTLTGGLAMGWLYEFSKELLIAYCITLHLLSLGLLLRLQYRAQ